MRQIQASSQFKKDLKRIKKQGRNLNLLTTIVEQLQQDLPLDTKYHDHALSGNYIGWRECHIQPDWLLIYRKIDHILRLERTASHSDLF
jgi:mRNA interferase YafQ